MKILAIETSCDETSAAILTEKDGRPVLLSNVVSSQIDLHKEYGGVVPEVAARAHIESIIPVIKKALNESGPKKQLYKKNAYAQKLYQQSLNEIDYIAVTYGPGLVGSLVVGVETAKALGLALNKPIIPINHLEGHIYANLVSNVKCHLPAGKVGMSNVKCAEPKFPIATLLVSGGHTMLIYMKNHLDYKIIGETRDDAAGEAFDKGARVLGLGYPGGPAIAKAAEEGDASKHNFPIIDLTEPPKRGADGFLKYPKPSLDFSFSGLKTALISTVKNHGPLTKKDKADLAVSFQKAIVDTLVQNSLRAVEEYKPKTFILSGGVAANKMLRETLESAIKKSSPDTCYLIPDTNLCTDNAGMIAAAAYYRIKKARSSELKAQSQFAAEPNLKF